MRWFMTNITLMAGQLCGLCFLPQVCFKHLGLKANLRRKTGTCGHFIQREFKRGWSTKTERLEMLTPLMSFNLSEVRLKFNSRPSPNARQCVCSPAVGRWGVLSWAQVFSLCLGLTLFIPEGHQELQTTEFFIKVTSWRDVPCSCCSLPQCVPIAHT